MIREMPRGQYEVQNSDTLLLERLKFLGWCAEKDTLGMQTTSEKELDLYSNFQKYILNPDSYPAATTGLFAINKPPEMSAQKGGVDNPYGVDEIARLATGQDVHCINRLDYNTSGVMLLGSTSSTRASICRQLENRTVKKTYLAILEGKVSASMKGVVAPLTKEKNLESVYEIAPQSDESRMAYTGISILGGALSAKTGNEFTIAQIRLFTGRSHQIRAHFALALGAPIVGDSRYGASANGARHLLHSYTTELRIPGTLDRVTFKAPVPDDFFAFLEGKYVFPVSPSFYSAFGGLHDGQSPEPA